MTFLTFSGWHMTSWWCTHAWSTWWHVCDNMIYIFSFVLFMKLFLVKMSCSWNVSSCAWSLSHDTSWSCCEQHEHFDAHILECADDTWQAWCHDVVVTTSVRDICEADFIFISSDFICMCDCVTCSRHHGTCNFCNLRRRSPVVHMNHIQRFTDVIHAEGDCRVLFGRSYATLRSSIVCFCILHPPDQ